MSLFVTLGTFRHFGGDAPPEGRPTDNLALTISADEDTVDDDAARGDVAFITASPRDGHILLQVDPVKGAELLEATSERIVLRVPQPERSSPPPDNVRRLHD